MLFRVATLAAPRCSAGAACRDSRDFGLAYVEAAVLPHAHLGSHAAPSQKRIHNGCGLVKNGELIASANFDQRVEGRRRLPLEDRLLRSAPSRFFVAERDGMNAAEKIRQRRIHQEVVERISVRRRDQLHAALGNRARGLRFGFGSDLVDDDHFRHVILDRFDHDGVLKIRPRHLHSAAGSDAGMGNVAVTGDFVRRIDDDHALVQFRGQNARAFAQQCRLSDSGPAEQQQALSGLDHVAQHINRAVHGAADTARQTRR